VLQPVADANGLQVDDLTKRSARPILNSSDDHQLQIKDADRMPR